MNRNPPNFLFIICDDLAYGDLSAHGNPVCRTPHLDEMADHGVSAQRHLSGPLCSPARACVLTGRYHYRSRVVDTYCGRSIMDPAEVTLADHLRAAGYRTGCFGKWHLGDTYPFRPEDRGFDETVWHLGGGIGQPGDHPGNFGRESYFDPVLCRDGKFETFEGYCTDIFTNEAMGFMRRNRGRPWFAHLALNAPHGPLQVDPSQAADLAARGATGDLPALYAMVENIDANVGRLLALLDETGQRDNTVVVFTSDHGPCPSVRNGEGRPRFNAGLRGEKGSLDDIANDPGEKHDLAAAEPEQSARLRAAYENWFRDVSANHRFDPVAIPVASAGLPLRLTRQDWRVCGEDGWSPQTKAKWVLDVRQPGTYEVTIQFDTTPDEPGAVFLKIGAVSAVARWVAGKNHYSFSTPLAPGPCELRAGWQSLYHEGSPFSVRIQLPG